MYLLPQKKISPLGLNTGLLSLLGLSPLVLTDQDLPQHDPDPHYREIVQSDVPSQYAEEVDTFIRMLSLPDPREAIPRSSTSVMGLDDEKGRQDLRPRGPSSMLPLSSVIKDAFDKFEHDFKAANLPEGKYIKPPLSTTKWYRDHILQRELYSMGNTGLLRREAEMTLLHPHLRETRHQEFTLLAFLPVSVSTCEGGRGLPPQKRHRHLKRLTGFHTLSK